MPNGDHDYSCPGLVEQAEYYVRTVKALQKERDELRKLVKELLSKIDNLKETIKLVKE